MPNFEEMKKHILKGGKIPPSVFLEDDEDATTIPFGVFSLDYLTNGGVPESRISVFWGDKATSKTTSAYRIINNYLRLNKNMKVIYVDFEGTFDRKWASHFIEDFENVFNKRLVVVRPDYGEQGIDIIREIAQSDDVGLIVVDSVAMMIPLGEYQRSAMDNVGVASLPRIMNSMFRRLVPTIAMARKQGRKLTLILINQIQMEIGMKSFGTPMSKPGGKKQGLLASLEIRFYPGKYHKTKDVPFKVTHIFKIEKHKLGLTARKGKYTMFLVPYEGKEVGQIDEQRTVLHYAKETEVLQREGSSWKWKDQTFKTLADVNKFLSECDRKTWFTFRRETLRKLWTMNPIDVSPEPDEKIGDGE